MYIIHDLHNTLSSHLQASILSPFAISSGILWLINAWYVALTVFILFRDRGTRAARSCRPAALAISKIRCWQRKPNPSRY